MNLRTTIIGVALTLAACSAPFRVKDYPTPMSLYAAGIAEYEKGNWAHAITALDQVTILLAPKDTLLPRAHFVLGRAYEKNKSYLLASATFKRLYEDFPDDSLADDALLAMADAEAKAWRGPEYSSEHAELALDAYSLLQRLFPASPLVKRAQEGEGRMNEGMAQKDLNNGVFYMRRHAWDSALIPLRDAASLYPGTAASHQAMIRMVEVYRNPKMKYVEDAKDLCKTLRASHGTDPAVIKACAGLPADTTRQ